MNHFEEVLWAKKKVEGSRLLWLPLWQHMEDTGFVMGQLWEHWLSQGVKDFIGENLYPLDEEEIKKLCVFLGYSHDLGKACASFQSMSGVPNQRDLDARLMENLERHGFTGISQLVLSSSRETPHALMGQALFMEYGVGEDISSIVGGMVSFTLPDPSPYLCPHVTNLSFVGGHICLVVASAIILARGEVFLKEKEILKITFVMNFVLSLANFLFKGNYGYLEHLPYDFSWVVLFILFTFLISGLVFLLDRGSFFWMKKNHFENF